MIQCEPSVLGSLRASASGMAGGALELQGSGFLHTLLTEMNGCSVGRFLMNS